MVVVYAGLSAVSDCDCIEELFKSGMQELRTAEDSSELR